MTDEDRMIKKLEEHRDAKKLIIEIGKLEGIEVIETKGNDANGDFYYPKDKESKLIKAIDIYLGHRKYIKEEE